jgi:hypothetical protein
MEWEDPAPPRGTARSRLAKGSALSLKPTPAAAPMAETANVHL